MCCLCNYIFKWLDIQVFSDKDFKLYSHLLHLIAPWLAGDDKVPTHLPKRVDHVVPSGLALSHGLVLHPLGQSWLILKKRTIVPQELVLTELAAVRGLVVSDACIVVTVWKQVPSKTNCSILLMEDIRVSWRQRSITKPWSGL